MHERSYGVASAVLVAVLGCSPIANLRPASGLMPAKKLELGAGAAVLSPRPYVTEDGSRGPGLGQRNKSS